LRGLFFAGKSDGVSDGSHVVQDRNRIDTEPKVAGLKRGQLACRLIYKSNSRKWFTANQPVPFVADLSLPRLFAGFNRDKTNQAHPAASQD
jgi:hypothetical protein